MERADAGDHERQATGTDDNAYAMVQAAFDDGSTTVLINAFVALDNTTDRCHMFGGMWPAS